VSVPFSIGQPSLALPQSIVIHGNFPTFIDGPFGEGSANTYGFIFQTAFNPAQVRALAQAQGQVVGISGSVALFSLIGRVYGGDGQTTFGLPNLQGAAPLYMTDNFGNLTFGQTQGNPSNTVTLTQQQLPSSLGGDSMPISNEQYGLGIQYVIQVNGQFPDISGPTPSTIGMIYATATLPRGGSAPNGFLPADGRLLSISEFNNLFQVLGTTYGGDGINTFALPDLRDRLPIGTGVTSQGQSITLGQQLGSSELTLTSSELPGVDETSVPTMQASLGLNYIVNTQGAFWYFDDETPMLGQVGIYAGSSIPQGWTLAQGQSLSISTNQALFALLGTAFGGDGISTFALPDLRGRTSIGTGGELNLKMGDVIGSFEQILTLENLPEILVPIPGVHIVNESGQVVWDKITGKFELDVTGLWPQGRVEFSSDGQTWIPSYTAQEGSNTLFVRQVAVTGQTSSPSPAIVFVYDSSTPETPQIVVFDVEAATLALKLATEPEEKNSIPRTSTGRITILGLEEGALQQFSIDAGLNWTESFEAQPGLNRLQVRQVDKAGNISPASETTEFFWDGSDTAPAQTSRIVLTTGGVQLTVEKPGSLPEGLGTDAVDVLIYGMQQRLSLPEDIENIILIEHGLGNTVAGNSSSNVFSVLIGGWVIEGGGGQDTVKLSHALADYKITQETHEGQLQATLFGPEGKLIVRGIQTIQFTDANLVQAAGTSISELDHLYEEVLGRVPDVEGLTYWASQFTRGVSFDSIAQAVAESAEFAQRYGTSPSREQLVEELYEAILNRSPDPDGLAFWAEALQTITRGELITGLLFSGESQAHSDHQPTLNTLFVLG